MTTAFADYPIGLIQPHPLNVRHTAVADDEMVASIRARGVETPVILGPDTGDGVRHLIAGNRRHDGALKAGLGSMPAVLRDDLVTDAQQIEAMVVENIHRSDLTVIEQAEAYEQLELFGADAAAIAEITGVSTATIKQRLKLTALPDRAKDKLHAGEASITDALALLEFEDDHELHAALTAALGTNDFSWQVRQARDLRDRRARNDSAAAKLRDDYGIPAARHDDDPAPWALSRFYGTETGLREPEAHPECLAYVNPGSDSYTAAYLVCLDRASHETGEQTTDSPERAAREAEWAAQQEEIARVAAERAAAAVVRNEAIREQVAAALPAKPTVASAKRLTAVAAAALPGMFLTGDLINTVTVSAWDRAFGLEHGAVTWAERNELAAATALRATTDPATARELLVVLLTMLIDDTITNSSDGDSDIAAVGGAAWDWLTSTGYELSSIDEQVHADATSTGDEDE